jgi:integrase
MIKLPKLAGAHSGSWSEFDRGPPAPRPKLGRDRLLLKVAYYGALRVWQLGSLTWGPVLPREAGEAQLAIVGKGDKPGNVLLPDELATALAGMLGQAPPDTRVARSRSAASTTS